MDSKRQQRKAARAGKRDKNGFAMNLSRPVRRALQRLQVAQSYGTRTGVKRLAPGESMTKDNSGSADHLLYAGGSMKCH